MWLIRRGCPTQAREVIEHVEADIPVEGPQFFETLCLTPGSLEPDVRGAVTRTFSEPLPPLGEALG